MTEEQLNTIGTELAKFFQLKPIKKTDRYETHWGDKTAIGVARCVLRIVEEGSAITVEEAEEEFNESRD